MFIANKLFLKVIYHNLYLAVAYLHTESSGAMVFLGVGGRGIWQKKVSLSAGNPGSALSYLIVLKRQFLLYQSSLSFSGNNEQ